MMDEKANAFLRRQYREFYFNHHDMIEIPSKMGNREFGYIQFGGGMVRHLSFRNPGELVAELVRQAPSSVYCSNAAYDHPTLQMDEKGWLGAELIFDIDADSIPTPCKSSHSWWYCFDCHKGGMGLKPSKCPNCRGQGVEQMHWSCRECLASTKEHVKRLVGFLVDDFGIRREEITLYFSGNRGYHAHVRDGRFESANSSMRGELANYIRGRGFNMKSMQDRTLSLPSLGWGSRASLFLARTSPPLKKNQKTTEQIIDSNAALIDESVTTDVHRVFRMAGTLHGSSGMLKMRVDSLEDFDPQKEPVVLGDEMVQVKVSYAPEFYLKGRKFGPYNSALVSLPVYAAVFLIARGLGGVAG
jgi:DNA primase small subunit